MNGQTMFELITPTRNSILETMDKTLAIINSGNNDPELMGILDSNLIALKNVNSLMIEALKIANTDDQTLSDFKANYDHQYAVYEQYYNSIGSNKTL